MREALRLVQNNAALAEKLEAVQEWHSMANCLGVDPDLFFPERGASTREAKEVCRACVVREDVWSMQSSTERSLGFGVE